MAKVYTDLNGHVCRSAVGFCKHHNCMLTVRQMRRKECIPKHCWHFVKYEKHPHWEQRRVRKALRKERKYGEKYIQMVSSTSSLDATDGTSDVNADES